MKTVGKLWFFCLVGARVAHAQSSFSDATDTPRPAPPARFAAAESRREEASEKKAAARARSAYLHDGFYLRFGLGAGYVTAKSERGSVIKGWGVAPDLWIGGSVTPGFAVGVTLNLVSVSNPRAKITADDTTWLGTPANGSEGVLSYYSLLGLFGDYYPDPRGGLHFMAAINYSEMSFSADRGPATEPATGIGLLAGFGYEWWIARQWSVGPLARLHWSLIADDLQSTRVLSPVLLLAVTCH